MGQACKRCNAPQTWDRKRIHCLLFFVQHVRYTASYTGPIGGSSCTYVQIADAANFNYIALAAAMSAGVNDIIKEHAQLIADAGNFRVLVPDLYKGKIGVDAEEASHVSIWVEQAFGVCTLAP